MDLTPSKFGHDFWSPGHFSCSQWQRDLPRQDAGGPVAAPALWYAACRALVSLFWVANFVSLLAVDASFWYFFIYLTNQGLIVLTVYDLTSLALVLSELYKARKGEVSQWMTPLHKTVWVMQNVSVPAAIFITLFYWIILYDAGTNDYWNVYVHGLNSVLALTDLALSAKPWRILHFYQPVLLGVWYTFFSLVYYWAGGEDEDGNPYIYDVLDWRDPGPTIGVVIGAFVGLCVVFGCVYGLFRLRVWAWQKWAGPGQRPAEGSEGRSNPTFTIEEGVV